MTRVATARSQLTGVLLAGGQGTRMGGGDKGLLPLAGKPLIAHGIRRLRPQVAELLISANRCLEQYRAFGYRVLSDAPAWRFRGPLAGLLAAMETAATPYVVSAPCDAPRLPLDYAARLWTAAQDAGALTGVACVAGCWQPVYALAAVSLRADLTAWLAAGEGGVGRWLRRQQPVVVEFGDDGPAWDNLNTPEQLARLEAEWSGEQDGGALGLA